jgi:glyoxylase I family protein
MSLWFSHVALSCRDSKATERFYSTHFGFRRARVIELERGQIVFLKAGGMYLELFDAEGPRDGTQPAADGPHGQGVRHIAFQTEDVDAKLAEMGSDARITLGPLDFDAFIPGWRTVWVADPDGNIVEISQGYRDEDPPSRPARP